VALQAAGVRCRWMGMGSRRSVDVVRAVWQRYADGGLPAVAPLLHEDACWSPHDLQGERLHGLDAILAHGRAMEHAGVRMQAFGHRFEDHDDCVVVVGRVRVLSDEGHYDIPMNWQVEVVDDLVTEVVAERRLEDARADCAEA
jgi:ketosteroid isomerase-like protein